MDLCKKCPFNPKVKSKVARKNRCKHVRNLFPNGKPCRYAQNYTEQDFVGRREQILANPNNLDSLLDEKVAEQWQTSKKQMEAVEKLNWNALSRKQIEILEMSLLYGMTERDIAEQIGISHVTVNYHLTRAKEKLSR